MKIERKSKNFEPIYIVIETSRELTFFKKIGLLNVSVPNLLKIEYDINKDVSKGMCEELCYILRDFSEGY